MRIGELGLLVAFAGRPARSARAPLPGPAEADVAIVGAGFTGLWTAYYLKRARALACGCVVLEASRPASAPRGATAAGSRASSRARPRATSAAGAAALRGAAARDVRRPSRRSRACCAEHGIDAELRQERRARPSRSTAPSSARLREQRAPRRAPRGLGEEDLRELSRRGAAARVAVAGRARRELLPARRAACTRRSCCVGLAAAVEALGVEIYERTPVHARSPRARADTAPDAVSARWVVRATEGYTAEPARAAARAGADEQLDDRHRAAGARRSGSRSAGRARDARRRRPRLRLPAAHRRRAHRDRRPRRPLPLRLAHRRPRRDRRARRSRACARSSRRCSRPPRARASLTPGRACSACRATGACRSRPTPRPGSPGPAATSARAWRRRTSPRARCAT